MQRKQTCWNSREEERGSASFHTGLQREQGLGQPALRAPALGSAASIPCSPLNPAAATAVGLRQADRAWPAEVGLLPATLTSLGRNYRDRWASVHPTESLLSFFAECTPGSEVSPSSLSPGMLARRTSLEQVGAQASAVSEPGTCMPSGPFSRLWLLSHPELGLRTPGDPQGQLILGEDSTLTLPFGGRVQGPP